MKTFYSWVYYFSQTNLNTLLSKKCVNKNNILNGSLDFKAVAYYFDE